MWSAIELVRTKVEPPMISGLVIGAAIEPLIPSRLAIGANLKLLMTTD